MKEIRSVVIHYAAKFVIERVHRV